MSCNCDHECENSDKEFKQLLSAIEYSIGNAININFTNAYKRNLMKEIIDRRIRFLDEGTAFNAAEERDKLLSHIEAIAKAETGYEATKEYLDILLFT